MANRKGAGGTAQAVEALVRPVVEAMGLCIWDVRFEKEGPDWFLRIYLDGGRRWTWRRARPRHVLLTLCWMKQTLSAKAITLRWAAPALAAV